MLKQRASGLLVHPTSLPGRFGIGDLGDEARRFVDFLVESGQRFWQVLPLGPTAYGDSPYQCFSAFAGNPLLVSPEWLVGEGVLPADALDAAPAFPGDRVDYGPVIEFKAGLLARARHAFTESRGGPLAAEYEAFCAEAAGWLEDYALYRAIKNDYGGAAWVTWDEPFAKRESHAMKHARQKLSEAIETEKFAQFLFFKQWNELRAYAGVRGVRIVGDAPIFVAHDSADVWAHRDLFKLDKAGAPTVVAGVPPDYFSETGQLWGNPLYDWDRMRKQGFRWWIERIRAAFRMVDVLRLDHFRGFEACWEVPTGEETAVNGRWVKAPGTELFKALKKALGDLDIIAEDLGVITPEVEALRDGTGFPGMHVLQFGFGDTSDSAHLLHNNVPNGVVYTGTHDNDTTAGWFASLPEGDPARAHCLKYLATDGEEIHWTFIRAALGSVARTAIVPLQDVLGLGSEARMNLPASESGNWGWRFGGGDLTPELAARLRDLADLYGRIEVVKKVPEAAPAESE
jgi:4-alpha-glucanotransferase